MALKGIKVLEFSGLAPGPFCGMVLSDFGASVTRIDKASGAVDIDRLAHGKRSLAVNLKSTEGISIIRKLSSEADVLIEPFRAGVMEKLGLGPDQLLQENPRLVYARLTGFGQKGVLSQRAGHDINYLAISGVLSMFGRAGEKPIWPVNLLADFAGGGLMCAFGIVMALFERTHSGKGQVVDASMTEGAAYIGSWLWKSKDLYVWQRGVRGENILDGGAACYDTYRTADNKYMSVGALEPQFYAKLLEGLGIDPSDAPQFQDEDATREKFAKVFAMKTQSEWMAIFDNIDACVTPVLSMEDAPSHPHNVVNNTFLENGPRPAPHLLRTPGAPAGRTQPSIGEHTRQVLEEGGFSHQQIEDFIKREVVVQRNPESKL